MRWKNDVIFTSKTLRGEWIGLEEIDDGVWSLYYGPVLLARFDEREMKLYAIADPRAQDVRSSTTRGELITCGIERGPRGDRAL